MAFTSQLTLTKRHADTTAVLGSQNSTSGDFYFWKSRDFASICSRKGVASHNTLNMPSLTSPVLPGYFWPWPRRRTERSFPSLVRWNSLISPRAAHRGTRGRGTGSRDARFLTKARGQHSCLGKHNRHFTLFKQVLQVAMTGGTCIHIGTHRFIMKPGVPARRSVYCHGYKLFLEHCVIKLFMSQKLAAIRNTRHIQLNFYLTRGFQTVPGTKQQH